MGLVAITTRLQIEVLYAAIAPVRRSSGLTLLLIYVVIG